MITWSNDQSQRIMSLGGLLSLNASKWKADQKSQYQQQSRPKEVSEA